MFTTKKQRAETQKAHLLEVANLTQELTHIITTRKQQTQRLHSDVACGPQRRNGIRGSRLHRRQCAWAHTQKPFDGREIIVNTKESRKRQTENLFALIFAHNR